MSNFQVSTELMSNLTIKYQSYITQHSCCGFGVSIIHGICTLMYIIPIGLKIGFVLICRDVAGLEFDWSVCEDIVFVSMSNLRVIHVRLICHQ